ncbi:MAG: FixH family protein [Burkholderiaceae bacterium]
MTLPRQPIRSWYREPWPWLIMAPPAAAVVVGLVMLTLAITSYDGLVSDDYYKQGLGINQILRRDERAGALNYRAHAIWSDDGRRVQVRFVGADNASASASNEAGLPDELRLRLVHPTRAGRDQMITLHLRAPGQYEAELTPPEAGRWQLTIEDLPRTWRVTGDWAVPGANEVVLAPRRLDPIGG